MIPFLKRLFQLSLLPLTWIYGLVVVLRNWAYDRGLLRTHHPALPIISVGNISTGGTGKTPMAELLLRELTARGLRPGYLSRGYGRKTKGYRRVDAERDSHTEVGDEALQVAMKYEHVPVAVCEDRVAGAEQLKAETGIDVLVLDDAFQHRRIGRRLDLVMVDGQRPPWQDLLLPAGRLREPLSSLERADLVVVNKLSNPKHIPRFKRHLDRPMVFAELTPSALVAVDGSHRRLMSELKSKNVWAFAALGNNEHFFDTFQRLGMRLIETKAFADHHSFSANEMKAIAKRFRKLQRQDVFTDELLLVTSEKDAARLRTQPWFQLQLGQLPLYYLEVELHIYEGKDIFDTQLDRLLGAHADPRSIAVR